MSDQNNQVEFITSDQFGERIRQLRKKLGMVQKDFGESLDVSLATITRIERGIYKPQADFLAKLALTYECDIHWLLTGEEQRGGGEGERSNKSVLRHPRIYEFLKAQRGDWSKIVDSSMKSVEMASEEEKLKVDASIREYREGIAYLDALLAVGCNDK